MSCIHERYAHPKIQPNDYSFVIQYIVFALCMQPHAVGDISFSQCSNLTNQLLGLLFQFWLKNVIYSSQAFTPFFIFEKIITPKYFGPTFIFQNPNNFIALHVDLSI